MKIFIFISAGVIIFLLAFVGKGGFWPSLLISVGFTGMLFLSDFLDTRKPRTGNE